MCEYKEIDRVDCTSDSLIKVIGLYQDLGYQVEVKIINKPLSTFIKGVQNYTVHVFKCVAES